MNFPLAPVQTDETVPPGTILHPGDYLVEVELARPFLPRADQTVEDRFAALIKRMGFSRCLLDQSLVVKQAPRKTAAPAPLQYVGNIGEWGSEVEAPNAQALSRFRCMVEAKEAMVLMSNADMRWLFVTPVSEDAYVFEEPDWHHRREHILEQGVTYDLCLASWEIICRERGAVSEALAKLGFVPQKIMQLMATCHMPNRPTATMGYWYVKAQWTKVSSRVTRNDMFWVERAVVSP